VVARSVGETLSLAPVTVLLSRPLRFFSQLTLVSEPCLRGCSSPRSYLDAPRRGCASSSPALPSSSSPPRPAGLALERGREVVHRRDHVWMLLAEGCASSAENGLTDIPTTEALRVSHLLQ